MEHISLLGDECQSLSEGDQSFSDDIGYVNMTWYGTPSIVSFPAGKYPSRDIQTFSSQEGKGKHRVLRYISKK